MVIKKALDTYRLATTDLSLAMAALSKADNQDDEPPDWRRQGERLICIHTRRLAITELFIGSFTIPQGARGSIILTLGRRCITCSPAVVLQP